MDPVTANVSNYIKDKGINVSKMSRDTGIPYISLYNSLLKDGAERELRGHELLDICYFLDKKPMDFSDRQKGGS